MKQKHQDERQAQGLTDGWVQVGAIVGTHGVRGDVKVRSFTQDPLTIKSFSALYTGPNGAVCPLTIGKPIKAGFSGRLQDVHTCEAAALFNGTKLFVPRDALHETQEDDEYFLADLIGLGVKTIDGEDLGHIRTVENFGADDLLDIVFASPQKGFGRFAMIPFTKALVPAVDIAAGFVTVDINAWQAMQVEAPEETSV